MLKISQGSFPLSIITSMSTTLISFVDLCQDLLCVRRQFWRKLCTLSFLKLTYSFDLPVNLIPLESEHDDLIWLHFEPNPIVKTLIKIRMNNFCFAIWSDTKCQYIYKCLYGFFLTKPFDLPVNLVWLETDKNKA